MKSLVKEGRRGPWKWMRKASQPPPVKVSVRSGQVVRPACPDRVEQTGHIVYPACSDTVCLVSHVDHMDPTPLYTQLADILREMIKSAELQPRSALPSESYLQQEQGVSRGTVRMAIGILRDEGLVVTIRGRGTFVTARGHQGG